MAFAPSYTERFGAFLRGFARCETQAQNRAEICINYTLILFEDVRVMPLTTPNREKSDKVRPKSPAPSTRRVVRVLASSLPSKPKMWARYASVNPAQSITYSYMNASAFLLTNATYEAIIGHKMYLSLFRGQFDWLL